MCWGGGEGRVWTVIQVNNSMFNDIISTLQILEITDLTLSLSFSRSAHALQKLRSNRGKEIPKQ